MLIRLIPRACDGLTDKSKCKELLEYCNPNDSTDVCTVKMIGKAFLNGGQYVDAAKGFHHIVNKVFVGGGEDIVKVVAKHEGPLYDYVAPLIHATGKVVVHASDIISFLMTN